MRTTGTFQKIYAAAKAYAIDPAETGCPLDPVVRCENGEWMLESGLEPQRGDFEVHLEDFDNWFFDVYENPEYTPSIADISDFVEAHKQ